MSKKNSVDTSDPGLIKTFDSLDEENVENARALLQLVKIRIENRYGYIKLFSLLTFFSIYLTLISVQQNVSDAFSIESRYEEMSTLKIKKMIKSIKNWFTTLQHYYERYHGVPAGKWTGRILQCRGAWSNRPFDII
jgi:hypothetical protein